MSRKQKVAKQNQKAERVSERWYHKPIVLSLLSVLLLSLPWLTHLSITVLVGFVPLLFIWKRNERHFLWWVFLTLFVWIAVTCWWVAIATPVALLGVPLFGLIYSWGPIAAWYKLQKHVPQSLSLLLLVVLYLTAEGLYTYAEFSFPWLTLGNAFAKTPVLVQWYEWTGVFGGSLWALLVNVLIFRILSGRKSWFSACALVLIPVVCSIVLYISYRPDSSETKQFTVIQPNIDPYTEKFNNLSVETQVDIVLKQAVQFRDSTDFFVAPETAVDGYIWTEKLSTDTHVQKIRSFLRSISSQNSFSPSMIIGATTLERAKPSEYHDYMTNRMGDTYYKVFNTALWVDTTSHVDFYHKGCLVVGAEKLPYPKVFRILENFLRIPLGDVAGNYGKSLKRDVYDQTGVAICYESVYSQYFTEYVKAGARYMTVITNDGWWHDTPGHRQHMSYSRLRAIETRRSIARSANTGISCFINGRGDILQSMGWDRRGALSEKLYADDRVTLYVRMGDWPVRLSWYVLALILLCSVSMHFRKERLIDSKTLKQ